MWTDASLPSLLQVFFFFFFLFMLCHVMNLIHGSEKSRKDRGTVFQSTIESMFENKEKKLKFSEMHLLSENPLLLL